MPGALTSSQWPPQPLERKQSGAKQPAQAPVLARTAAPAQHPQGALGPPSPPPSPSLAGWQQPGPGRRAPRRLSSQSHLGGAEKPAPRGGGEASVNVCTSGKALHLEARPGALQPEGLEERPGRPSNLQCQTSLALSEVSPATLPPWPGVGHGSPPALARVALSWHLALALGGDRRESSGRVAAPHIWKSWHGLWTRPCVRAPTCAEGPSLLSWGAGSSKRTPQTTESRVPVRGAPETPPLVSSLDEVRSGASRDPPHQTGSHLTRGRGVPVASQEAFMHNLKGPLRSQMVDTLAPS